MRTDLQRHWQENPHRTQNAKRFRLFLEPWNEMPGMVLNHELITDAE